MGLFRLNIHGEIEVDREETQLIAPYYKIVRRDRGSEGDCDGRKKLFALKELGYIFWVADYNSPGNKKGLNAEELHEDAIKNFELPKGWKPDEVVQEGIRIYKEEQNTDSLGTLIELRKSLRVIDVAAAQIRKRIEESVKKLSNPEVAPNVRDMESVDVMVGDIEKLLSITEKVSKATSNLDQLVSKVRKEQADSRRSKGGKRIGNRADPSTYV